MKFFQKKFIAVKTTTLLYYKSQIQLHRNNYNLQKQKLYL